jgi:hypothetical protein
MHTEALQRADAQAHVLRTLEAEITELRAKYTVRRHEECTLQCSNNESRCITQVSNEEAQGELEQNARAIALLRQQLFEKGVHMCYDLKNTLTGAEESQLGICESDLQLCRTDLALSQSQLSNVTKIVAQLQQELQTEANRASRYAPVISKCEDLTLMLRLERTEAETRSTEHHS